MPATAPPAAGSGDGADVMARVTLEVFACEIIRALLDLITILTSQGSALISQNNRGTTVLPAKARMR